MDNGHGSLRSFQLGNSFARGVVYAIWVSCRHREHRQLSVWVVAHLVSL